MGVLILAVGIDNSSRTYLELHGRDAGSSLVKTYSNVIFPPHCHVFLQSDSFSSPTASPSRKKGNGSARLVCQKREFAVRSSSCEVSDVNFVTIDMKPSYFSNYFICCNQFLKLYLNSLLFAKKFIVLFIIYLK